MPDAERSLRSRWIQPATSSFRRLLGVVREHRGLLALVLALLLIDFFWSLYFGVGRMLHELERDSTLYNHKELLITTDGGIPEWFNYAQTILLVVLLFRLTRRTQQPIYLSLALIFLYVGLDDAMELHEAGGKFFVREYDIPKMYGLRARDIGEVITWSLLGVFVVPGLLFTLAWSRPRDRGNGLALLLAFAGLLFCAVFVDQFYSSFHKSFLGAGVLIDVVEDGGEMFAITIACALALGAEREFRSSDPGV